MKRIPAGPARSESVAAQGKVMQQILTKLVKRLGGGYSSALGIDLDSAQSDEIFKWFLASILLGVKIEEGIAIRTYREFEEVHVLSPETILKSGRKGLADILSMGGYGEHAFKTANMILESAQALTEKYEGDLNRLHFFAANENDLKRKLQSLGQGIGLSTVNIFLREMRDQWDRARPQLPEHAVLAANKLGLTQATDAASALEDLRVVWEGNAQRGQRFSDFEAVIVKLGKSYCQKNLCVICPVRTDCQNANPISKKVRSSQQNSPSLSKCPIRLKVCSRYCYWSNRGKCTFPALARKV